MDEDLDDEDSQQKPLRTTFELNDTLYAEAEVEDSDTVFLWLGVRLFAITSCYPLTLTEANVMLSYPIPEAISLLRSKQEAASLTLSNTNEDIEFLREQVTVMEVNIARVYNWDVKRRRDRRLKEQAEGKTTEG